MPKSNSGYVQALNNYYQQTLKRPTGNIEYTTTPGSGDTFTAIVTLKDKNLVFRSGPVVGKQAAKEDAAKSALQSLGVRV
ncbi:hypothetical protein AURDEDRAFT_169413 [Auricularia subglabra TFB-10046 SS5]|nr:hypothetical protein AURDEDRAFT_169413 [Auricularia subglabra TFB-10046 SS5]